MNTTEKILYNIQNLLIVIIYFLIAIISIIILFKSNTFLGYFFLFLIVIYIWYKTYKIKFIEVKGGKT